MDEYVPGFSRVRCRRWQVEWVFKRFKSLAQLGHLPKYGDESAKAWLYGKLPPPPPPPPRPATGGETVAKGAGERRVDRPRPGGGSSAMKARTAAGFPFGTLLPAVFVSVLSLFVPERAAANYSGIGANHHSALGPTNLTWTLLKNRRIRITWTDPNHPGFEGVRAGISAGGSTSDQLVANLPDILSARSNTPSATTITVPTSAGNSVSLIAAAFFNNGIGRAYSGSVERHNFAVRPLLPSGVVAWPEAPDQMGLYWTDPNDQYVTGYEYQIGPWAGYYGPWTAISGSGRNTTAHTFTGLSAYGYTFRLRAKDNYGGRSSHVQRGPMILPATTTETSKFNVSVVVAGGTTASAVTEANLGGAEVRMTPKGGWPFTTVGTSGTFSWGSGADAGSDAANFSVGGLAGASLAGGLRPVCQAGTGALKAGCARPASGSYTPPAWRGVRVAYNGDVTTDQTLRISFARTSNVLVPAAPGWVDVKVHALPQPTAAALTSTPGAARGYDVGETIRATVTFSYPVAVGGTPRLALSVGGQTRYAGYASRSADKLTLTFEYTVALNDEDGDGVGIGTGALGLDGGSIVRDGVASAPAVLALASALVNQSGHKVAAGRTDYDRNDNGLIEVSTAAQLHAMRRDLDGNGAAAHADYVAAFPLAVAGMGCPSSGCVGYELAADLDLDVAPYNAGGGWEPVGGNTSRFGAVFRGNGRTISGLYLNRSRNHSGLFGATGSGSRIEGVGLLGPRVLDGQGTVGALVGLNGGEVRASYVSGGTVTADTSVGMLVGANAGVVADSYAVGGTVECRQGHPWSAGGSLVGGQGAGGSIRRSYATGTVTGICGSRGALVGGGGTVQAGYYDAEASEPDRGGGEGRTTRALKAPVASAGPYSTWSAVVWHFGTSRQYPVLRAGGHRPTAQFARQGLSDDASLGALTVSGAVLSPAFAAGTSAYTVAVGHEVGRMTVAATPARSVSTVGFVPAVDADPSAEGHQVDLSEGVNAVAVEVGAEDGTTTRRYAVSVTRARAPGLDLARSLGVAEGGSGTYTVALATRPTGAVTVAVAKVTGSSANVSVSPASLTFTVSDWDGAQTVTVDAADDADTDPDAATVRHSASGGGYGAVSADLAVSVAENDAPGLVVDRTVLGVAEGGTGTYTVALATRPAGAVTVAVAPVAGGSADVSVTPPSLTFAVSGWDGAQTVTVSAADDADAVADAATVRHRASGADYGSVSADLSVTVTESDRTGLRLAPKGLAVAEGGTGTYTVALASAPAGAVTVAVAPVAGSSADVSVAPPSLTFTASDWNGAQTVVVSAADDDDAVADAATMRHRASGADYGSVSADLAVAVTEGDRTGLVLSGASLSVEEGGSGTYTVALASAPTGAVTVSVAKATGGSADVGVSPASLTFAVSDWDGAQTVVVRAADDADTDTDTATVLHTAVGGDYEGLGAGLAVRVSENDYAGVDHDDDNDGLIEVSTAAQLHAMRWDLDGDGAVDAVADHAQYVAAFVGAMPGMGCRATGCVGYELAADLDLGVSPYNAGAGWEPVGGNTSRFGAVFRGNGRTISGLYSRSRGNYSGLFGATGSGSRIEGVGLLGPRVLDGQGTVGGLVGLNGGEVRTSYVSGGTVTANTTVGMLVGGNTGVVEDSYAVGGMVECRQGHPWSAGGSLVGDQGAGGSIRRSYATGTVTGICGSRGVLVGGTGGTVRAGYYDAEASEPDRGGGEGRTTRALKAPVASAGPYSTWSAVVWHFGTSRQYPVLRAGGHRPTAQFARQGLSDDASLGALTVSGAVLSPAFAAGTSAYTAAVGHEVGRVTVAATPARSVSTVGFVPAVDADPSTEGHQVDLSEGVNAVAVEVGAEDGTTTRRYAVAVTRARAPGLDLARSLGVAEGGSGTYTVALATRPTGAVTVAVAKATGSSANVSVSPASLTFTVSDWDGAQTVTVSAADDADTDPDAATVRHSASGGGYGAVSADLAVSVAENDAPGLVVDADPASTVIDPGPLALSEGDAGGASKGYTVRLATRPAGAVTVTVASADAAAVAVDTDRYTPGDQGALVFDASTWGTARTVTARAPDDADAGAESVVLSHTAAGGAYTGVDATLTVTVADDDVLAAPANLVVGAQVQALHLAWDAVAGAGGYKVQWTSGGQAYDGSRQVLSTATTHTLASLAAGAEYTVRVLATRSGAHDGPASAEATGTPRALPVVSIDAPRVHEGAAGAGGTLRFTVALGHASQQQVTVGYADAGTGTATSGTDYTALGAGVLTFAPGTTARTLDVAVTGDGADESDETVVVVLSSPVNAVLGTASGAGAIVDDDGTPSVSIDSPSVAEGAGEALRFTVSLSHASAQSVTVRYADAGTGTATSGTDYTALGAGVLTFAAGESTRTLDVAVIDDALEEADETVVVVLSSPANAVLGAAARGAGAIANDDAPTVALVLTPAAIDEGGSANVATVTATLSGPAAGAVTLTVTAAAGTNAVAADFTQTGTTLTIAANATTSTGTVTVTAVDDSATSGSKSVTVSATAASAWAAGAPVAATLTIRDDESSPTATLVLTPSSVSEAGGVATVTATLNRASAAAATLTVAAAAGENTGAGDFTLSAADTLTFAAGATTSTGTVTVTVTAVADTTDSPDKSVTVSATVSDSLAPGLRVLAPGAVTLAIADDDDAPTVVLSVAPSPIAEAGGEATVSAALSHPSSEPTTVTVVEGEAGAYTVASGAGATIVIAAGQTVNAADTAVITAVDNDVDAPDNAVTVVVVVAATARNSQGVGAVTGAALAITDDDTAAVVVSPAPSTTTRLRTTEAGATATFTVKLGSEPTGNVVLDVASTDTTEGTVSPSSLTFTDSTWNVTQTVTLTGVDDAPANLADGAQDYYTVTLRVDRTGTVDAGYDTLGVLTVYAVNADDDGLTGPAVWQSNNNVFDVTTSSLTAAAFRQTVTVKAPSARNWNLSRIVACSWRSVQPANSLYLPSRLPSGCRIINNLPGVTGVTLDSNITPTATEISNGGVVVLTSIRTQFLYSEWVPLVAPGITVSPAGALSLTEGESGTYNVKLAAGPSDGVKVRVASNNTDVTVNKAAGTAGSSQDLSFTASTWNTNQAITVAAAEDGDRADESATLTYSIVTADTASDYDGVTNVTRTVSVTDIGKTPGILTGAVTGTLTEAGGSATFTVALGGVAPPTADVTVAVSSGDTTEGTVSPSSLTFTRDNWSTTQTVTVTGKDDDVDDGNVVWNVRLAPSSGDANYNGLSNVDVPVITTDDDAAPGVTLALSSASISENGGVSTVSATLSHPSSAATTVTVTAVAGAYTVGPDASIVIAAGQTVNAADTVTLTAVDNDVDAPDNAVTVAATARNSQGVGAVTGAALAITDDDAAPDAVLSVSPSSIAESGGVATVTATLSHPSSEPTTVTVAAAPGANAMAGDYTLSAADTLTIAAGATASTGTVTVTAVNDTTDAPDRQVTVSATAASALGATAPAGVTLTITDDDAAPGAVLSLSPASILENGGESTVGAVLSHPSSEPTTVTVAAVADAYSVASGAGATIVIAAGQTVNAADTAVVTAVDNPTDAPDRTVTVGATLANGQGAGTVTGAALVLADDDDAPGVTLSVNPPEVSENAGVAVVTATLSHPSSQPTTVTVEAVADAYSVGSDATIVVAAGETTSTDTATVSGSDNAVHTGTRTVTVRGAAGNGQGVGAVGGAALGLTDDEPKPTVALVLTPAAIDESGTSTVSTVTATLGGPAAGAVTLTVTAAAGANAVAADFTQTGTTLTIAANATTSTGTVTVTAVDDNAASGSKSVTVSATAASAWAAGDPVAATLTIRDDESPPTATLVLTPSAVSEAGGVATVTATLNRASAAAATLTVVAAAGENAGAGDFTLGAADTLTFAAGATTSTGTVTVTAVADTTDSPDKSVAVSATVSDSRAPELRVLAPGAVTLAIADDDDAPTVVLSVAPSSIAEAGGEATVSAVLSHPSSEPTTVTVVEAVAGAYSVGSDATIVIAAGETTSTDTATVSGSDNAVHTGTQRTVTVGGSAANGQGVGAVTGAALALTDDEPKPTVALVLTPAVIDEGGTTSTVSTVTATLGGPAAGAVTLTVSAAAGANAVAADFTQTGTTLTIAANATTSMGAVTVTAVDDSASSGSKSVTVSATAASAWAAGDPVAATLTIRDDESSPTATLVLTPSSVAEAGGVATVTATLNRASTAAATLTVAAAAGANAGAGDFTLGAADTLTFAAGATASTGTVTVTAVADTTDSPDKSVTVSATVSDSRAPELRVLAPGAVTLAIADDDDAPTVVLSVAPSSIAEAGGEATVSAALSHPSSEPTTVTVVAVAGAYTVGPDTSIVIAAGQTVNAADTAVITAVDNDVDAPDRTVTVAATARNSQGVGAVTGAALAITDDDTAALVVSPAPSTTTRLRTTEEGGTAAFEVELGSEPTGNVVLAVASGNTSEGTVSVSSLTFTATSWDTAQTVTLTGVDDSAADGARNYTVTLTVNTVSTADTRYDALSAVTVYAVNAADATTADVNQDGLVDEDDVLVMYYAYTAPGLLNRSRLRRLVLRPLLGRGSSIDRVADTDDGYMTMLSNANDWKNNPSAGGDVNQDGLMDEDDVLVMYYAYTAPGLLNRSRLRRLVLRPLRGRGSSIDRVADTDDGYMTMLSNANALSTSP